MMSKYEIIIYWSKEDKLYLAEVPELPGCMADGNSYQEAVSNAEIIINVWIETAKEMRREIPKPKEKLIYAYPSTGLVQPALRR
ncbi:MAG: type II toxin-antitoxin system HicB family antitoxin [Candidatus Muiribacteriota bacterium]